MIVRRPLAALAPTTLAFAAAVLAGPAAHAAPPFSAPSAFGTAMPVKSKIYTSPSACIRRFGWQ